MHLPTDEEATLRAWMINRLDNFNDIVDCEVLTDFVFTLLRGNDSIEKLEIEVSGCLQDILEDETENFVRDLFREISHLIHREIPIADESSEREPVVARHSSRKRRLSYQSDNHVPFCSQYQQGSSYAFASVQNNSDLDQVHPDRRPLHNSPYDSMQNRWTNPFNSVVSPRASQEQTWRKKHKPNATPSDPPNEDAADLPDLQAGFKAMQNYFPALTQMWLNNTYIREALQSRGFNDPCTPGHQEETVDETVDRSKIKCYDYDMTGMCIRGSSCSYQHERSHTNLNLNNTSQDKANNNTKVLTNPTSATPTPNPPPPESLFMQNIRTRQTHFQRQHNKKKAEAQECEKKRSDLARKMQSLQADLEAEKAKLKAKLAEKESRVRERRNGQKIHGLEDGCGEREVAGNLSGYGQPGHH